MFVSVDLVHRDRRPENNLLFVCVFSGAVAVHKSKIQSQEEELQELWDCHSEPVQGD